MKRFLLFVCVLAGSFSMQADVKRLVMGFDDYPPFTGRDGSPRIAVDLMDTAMKRLGKNVDMIMVRPGDFQRVFTDRRIQASPALWYSKEREKEMVYSKPIFQNRLILVGRKGSGAADLNPKNIQGKRIAVVAGYAYGAELENSGAELVMGKSDQDNMSKLMAGEVDLALVEQMLVTYARRVQADQFDRLLEFGTQPLFTKNIHFAVKRSVPKAKGLVKELDRELEAMRKDGTFHRIMGVESLVMDIDGDGKPELVMVGDPAKTLNPGEVFLSSAGNALSSDLKQVFLVDNELYASLDEIPEEKRALMQAPAPGATFEFNAL